MDRTALHQETRNALSVADELSRYEHSFGADALSGCLAALRTAISDLEREVGRSHAGGSAPEPATVEAFERALQALLIRRFDVSRSLRPRTEQLLASTDAVLVVTDHSNVDYHVVVRNASLILDTRNALKAFDDNKVVRL